MNKRVYLFLVIVLALPAVSGAMDKQNNTTKIGNFDLRAWHRTRPVLVVS